jgi:putative membrane protein
MRVPKLSVAFFAVVLGAAACNRSEPTNEISTETNLAEDPGANAALGADSNADASAAALPVDAAGFANAVAASDRFEIESSKVAADLANSPQIKTFAEQLRADHEKSTSQLKAAAAKATPAVTVTPTLDPEQKAMLNQLKGATGADFDRRFIDQQTTAHQKALSLLRNYVGKGDAQSLKDFASKAATVVEGHLEHVNSIRK